MTARVSLIREIRAVTDRPYSCAKLLGTQQASKLERIRRLATCGTLSQ